MAQQPVASASANPSLNEVSAVGAAPQTDLTGFRPDSMLDMNSHSKNVEIASSSQDPHIKNESDSGEEAHMESEDEDVRTFEPKPSLPEARVEHRTLQDLMNMLEKETVDLNPQYQRAVVWDRSRMMGLIDSIIENYYIPPIIFNRQIARDKDGNGRIKRTCVDGKQRLSSVKAFMEGSIGCHDGRGGVWYFSAASVNGVRIDRRTIPENIKNQFRNRKFICFEYPNLRKNQEEDLFSRVQMGVQLSVAEKTRATTGPWQEFAKLYERDFPIVTELSATKRSAGFNNVLLSFAQILEVHRCIATGVQPDMKTPTMTVRFLLKNTEDYNPYFRDIFRQTFVKFNELAQMDYQPFSNKMYSHARKFSPFEFVASAVLISLLREKQDNEVLSESIMGMRAALRFYLMDIRTNRVSWIIAWNFIEPMISQPRIELSELRNVLAERLSRSNHPHLRAISSGTRLHIEQGRAAIPSVPLENTKSGSSDRVSPVPFAHLGNTHGLPSVPSTSSQPPSAIHKPIEPRHASLQSLVGPYHKQNPRQPLQGRASIGTQEQANRGYTGMTNYLPPQPSETDQQSPTMKLRPLTLNELERSGLREQSHKPPSRNVVETSSTTLRREPGASSSQLQKASGSTVSLTSSQRQQPRNIRNHKHQTQHFDDKTTRELASQVATHSISVSQPISADPQPEQEASAARDSPVGKTSSMTNDTATRKKRLTRFTTSSNILKGKERKPPFGSVRSTVVQASHEASVEKPTTQSNGNTSETITNADQESSPLNPARAEQRTRSKKRMAASVIELSDEESQEAAEALLAKFNPHTSKRSKAKKDKLEV